MKRTEILQKAITTVESRGATHGASLVKSFSHAANLWTTYLDHPIEAQDVVAMLMLLKMSRIKMGNAGVEDHYVDIAGYAALMGELNGKV